MSAAPTPEDLLIHGPFLRRLARRLLRDEQAAEDLVQQTWLAVLDRPPEGVANLGAWLTTIAKRLASDQRRGARRRRAREEAAAPSERAPSTAEVVAREGVRRTVVEALLTLDEPYREVLLLRFYEDLPPRRIAALLELPVETVRTRIKRGVTRLGRELDAGHDGDRQHWLGLVAPLARPRWSLAAALPAPLLWGGGLALLLGVLSWSFAGHGPPSAQPGRAAPIEVGASAAIAVSRGVVGPAVGDDGGALAERLDAVADAGARLVGRLSDAGGAPVSAARVWVTQAAPRRGDVDPPRELRSDDEGRYVVAGLSPGLWTVSVDTGRALHVAASVAVGQDAGRVGRLRVSRAQRARATGRDVVPLLAVDADGEGDCHTRLPDGASRTVRCVSAGGSPLPDAELLVAGPSAWMGSDADPRDGARWSTLAAQAPRHRTDAAGRVTDVELLPGGWLAVRASGHAPRVVALDDAPLARPVPTIVLEPCVPQTLSGSVQRSDGLPAAGVQVLLAPVGGSQTRAVARAEVERLELQHVTTTTLDGRFRFDDVQALSRRGWRSLPLTAEAVWHVHALPDDGPGVSARLEVDAGPGAQEVTLTLPAGAPLAVIVTSAGTPLAGAVLRVEHETSAHCLRWDTLTTDSQGRATLAGVRHGGLRLELDVRGHELVEHTEVHWAGLPLQLDVDLRPAAWTLAVDLTDGGGTALPGGLLVRDTDAGPVQARCEVLAWDRDPADPLHASGAVETRGVWEAGRAWLTFREDHRADTAWIGVRLQGELVATRQVVRGEDQLALAVPALDGVGLVPWRATLRSRLPIARVWLAPRVGPGHASAQRGLARDSWTTLVRPGIRDVVLEGPSGDRQVLRDIRVSATGTGPGETFALPEPAIVEPRLPGALPPGGGDLVVHDAWGTRLLRRVWHTVEEVGPVLVPPGRLELVWRTAGGEQRVALELHPGERQAVTLTAPADRRGP